MLNMIKNIKLNDIKIRTLSLVMIVVLVIIGGTVIGSSVFTFKEVNNLGQTWQTFEKGPASKMVILTELQSAIGFGGMIHQFKNYVLRRDRARLIKIQAKIREIVVNLIAYKTLGVNKQEEQALGDIQSVVTAYADATAKAEKLAAEGKSPVEIDKSVSINDWPALTALAVLDKELLKARQSSAKAVDESVVDTISFVTTSATVVGLLVGLMIGG